VTADAPPEALPGSDPFQLLPHGLPDHVQTVIMLCYQLDAHDRAVLPWGQLPPAVWRLTREDPEVRDPETDVDDGPEPSPLMHLHRTALEPGDTATPELMAQRVLTNHADPPLPGEHMGVIVSVEQPGDPVTRRTVGALSDGYVVEVSRDSCKDEMELALFQPDGPGPSHEHTGRVVVLNGLLTAGISLAPVGSPQE